MDAATVRILRDVAVLVWIALAIGAAAYNLLRTARPALAWNWRGRVDVRDYRSVDAVVASAIVMMPIYGLMQMDTSKPSAAFELSVWSMLGNMAVVLVLCIMLLFYLRVVRGLNPADLFGLRKQGFWRALGLAIAFIIPTVLVVNFFAFNMMEWLKTFWPNESSQDLVEGFRKSDSVGAKALMVVLAVVVAPLVEETFFRGFIYGVIKRYTDGYFAAICSALLFALIHFHVGSFAPLALLALGFCLAYEMTGSLLVPVAMHAVFNATNLALMSFGVEPT